MSADASGAGSAPSTEAPAAADGVTASEEDEERRKAEKPQADAKVAISVLRDVFGFAADEADINDLDSYDDRNFMVLASRISDGDGAAKTKYVLKIHNGVESTNFSIVEAQIAVAKLCCAAGIPCPDAVPTLAGEDAGFYELPLKGGGGATRRHAVRMLSFLPGKLLADVDKTPELLFEVGKSCGAMDKALQEFDHPATHRNHIWDLANVLQVRKFVHAIADDTRRELVSSVLDGYEATVVPALESDKVRKGVIHNDANDHNLLVFDDGSAVSGVIDFGDMVRTTVVNEIAIAAAYLIMGHDDPLPPACSMIAGYHSEFPLNDEEIAIFRVLVAARLATSATLGAYSYSLDPGNEYLLIHATPAFKALGIWWGCDDAEVTAALRTACGLS